VGIQPGRLPRWKPDSPAAAWYFLIFPTKILHFVGKDQIVCHAGGDIRHQTRDRLMYGSIGRFAVFAHVVVFVVQTPTA